MELRLDRVTLDPDCQPRVELNEAVAEDYAESLRAGCLFPPIVVFKEMRDGKAVYWLASGFHRHRAHVLAGHKTIQADVRDGTRRDAILFSVGTNIKHGLHRSNADKRRAALVLLTDAEWGRWSAREIARRCGVSPAFVDRLREELSASERQMREEVQATRSGSTYTVRLRDRPPEEQAAAVEAETDRRRPGWEREGREALETAERCFAQCGEEWAGVLASVRQGLDGAKAVEKAREKARKGAA